MSRKQKPSSFTKSVQGLAVAAAIGAGLGIYTQHPSLLGTASAASHSSRAGLRWPFPQRHWSQFRQVDEGVDLQYPGTTSVPVYAVAAGRVVRLGPDLSPGGGFGKAYPGLVLDNPVTVDGHTFTEVYYGHTFLRGAVTGHHVRRGAVIGYTGGAHSGGNAHHLPNWLEIGFFPPSYANGPSMRSWLSVHPGGSR